MKVRVKLFGTLSQGVADYQHSQGMEIEIPHGATAGELLAHLDIPQSRGAAVAVEGRLLNADDRIQCGVPVHILQVIQGG